MSCPTGNPWAILGRENPSSTDRNTAREGDIDVSRSELWRLIERDMGGRANGTDENVLERVKTKVWRLLGRIVRLLWTLEPHSQPRITVPFVCLSAGPPTRRF